MHEQRRIHENMCARNAASRFWSVFAICLVVTLTMTGCASTGNDGAVGSPDSIHFTATQFDDIPVPYGYRMMERLNESLVYERQDMRIGRTKYRGRRESLSDVNSFYREHMEEHHGWTFAGESVDAGNTVLSFAKRPYKCDVTIYQNEDYNYIDVKVDTIHES